MLAESIVALIVITGAAFLLGRVQRDVAFTNLMLVYGIVLSVATIFSLHDSVVHGSWNAPEFGNSDGEGYFIQAQLLAEEGILDFQTLIRSNYLGYQIFLGFLFSIFGASVAVGVIANNILLLLTIVCLYRAALLLTGSQRAAMLACAALMLTTANIFYSLVLLKEPALGLAFALVLLVLTKTVIAGRVGLGGMLQLVAALAIIVTMRSTVLLFLVVLFAFVGSTLIRRRAHIFVALIALLAISVPIAQNFTIFELGPERITQEVTRSTVIESRLEQGDLDVSGVAGQVGGAYIRLPFPVKIALFPIPTMLQSLLPFNFWSTRFLDEHFALLLIQNLNIIWLLFVLPWFIFAVANVRRVDRPLIGRLLLAGLAYYVIVAVIYGGLIPRYGTPAMIFVYPAIGYWWARRWSSPAVRDRSARFFVHYYALFTFAGLSYLALQVLR